MCSSNLMSDVVIHAIVVLVNDIVVCLVVPAFVTLLLYWFLC